MENKKLIAIYSLTHNDKIQSLRSFLNDTNLMYDYQKTNLNSDEFKSYLKSTCVIIEEKLTSTIDYYQHTKSGELEFKKAKEKYKDLFILLRNYKLELISLGNTESEYLAFKKDIETAFDFDIDTKKKSEPLPNYLEIKKEFEEFIKIGNFEIKEKYLFPAEKANEDANNFFNYLVKNYNTKKGNTGVKYFNILQYLRNYAPKEKYTFKITNKEYEPIIEESFGIKITNWNESENFKGKIIPELNGHESKFCSNKC